MHYRPFGAAPAPRRAVEPMGLGLLAGLSALFGGLFYMADVTIPHLLRHPLWSLRH